MQIFHRRTKKKKGDWHLTCVCVGIKDHAYTQAIIEREYWPCQIDSGYQVEMLGWGGLI